MKNGLTKGFFFVMLLTLSSDLAAQSGTTSSNAFVYGMLAVVGLIILALVLQVSDNLMLIEAKQSGISDKTNFSLFPKINEIFRPDTPEYVSNTPVKVLTKGHDILLEGEAGDNIAAGFQGKTFAIQPPNFIGISPIPKVTVEEGAMVKAGDPLFFDKKVPDVMYASPVSGKVVGINRGAKRSIANVVIESDGEMASRDYATFDVINNSREELVAYLMDSGVWPMIRQRPYNIVPEATSVPRDIFISTFDTAPLAPNLNHAVAGREKDFQAGLDILNQLTSGKVYLGLSANGETAPSDAFTTATGVEKVYFQGAHPAGNVGVQIHHIRPIGTQDKVWTVDVQTAITIGTLFTQGRFDASRLVALVGAELETPQYVRTFQGANIGELIAGNLKGDNVRLVSGDVLTGDKASAHGFLGYHDDMVTTIAEGDYYEMFGWLLPLTPRPSISNTYPNALFGDLKFEADTNTHGERRAFVVTGQYEQVTPMDVLVQPLMKAILVNDYERMEGLGLHELVEEDVALAEFVCTSKQPLQSILREGLEMMREQG
ncbi:MAG: Na(+)-translocating NADH-quinone reductase subunit A [Saprospiraceae bacterium]